MRGVFTIDPSTPISTLNLKKAPVIIGLQPLTFYLHDKIVKEYCVFFKHSLSLIPIITKSFSNLELVWLTESNLHIAALKLYHDN
jgi:hypothetical protein